MIIRLDSDEVDQAINEFLIRRGVKPAGDALSYETVEEDESGDLQLVGVTVEVNVELQPAPEPKPKAAPLDVAVDAGGSVRLRDLEPPTPPTVPLPVQLEHKGEPTQKLSQWHASLRNSWPDAGEPWLGHGRAWFDAHWSAGWKPKETLAAWERLFTQPEPAAADVTPDVTPVSRAADVVTLKAKNLTHDQARRFYYPNLSAVLRNGKTPKLSAVLEHADFTLGCILTPGGDGYDYALRPLLPRTVNVGPAKEGDPRPELVASVVEMPDGSFAKLGGVYERVRA